MIREKEATTIIRLIDEEMQQMKSMHWNDEQIRNVCIRKLQNCKNAVFLNSELHYKATGIRRAI